MRKYSNRRGETDPGTFMLIVLIWIWVSVGIGNKDDKILKAIETESAKQQYQIAGLEQKVNRLTELLEQINHRTRNIENANVEK